MTEMEILLSVRGRAEKFQHRPEIHQIHVVLHSRCCGESTLKCEAFGEVPVDTGTSDFTFDSRPDFEDDLDDFLSSFLCLFVLDAFSSLSSLFGSRP